MLGAAHLRGVGFQERLDGAQIQRRPPPTTLALVETRAASPAPPEAAFGRLPGPHRHHHSLLVLVELHALDDRRIQSQQSSP